MSPTSQRPPATNHPSGRVCLWRYASDSRNYAGTHLTADSAGCDTLLAYLAKLETALEASSAQLSTATPNRAELEVVGHRAPILSAATWTIRHDPQADASTWRLVWSPSAVLLEVGKDQLKALQAGVADIRRGTGDYCIGAGGEEL
ncbi:MAG: hypothetical protein U0836_27230 [Pirellulales bacterium]